MINLPNDSLDIIGKQTPQIATQLLGGSSDFRSLFEATGISPLTPQSVIDQIGKIDGVQEIRQKLGKLTGDITQVASQLKPAVADKVKIDWLN